MKMNRKDAASVKKLEAELVRIRNEINAISEPYEQRIVQSLVGLCFRTRNNYSCPEKPSDYWWLYVRVLRVDGGALRGLRFEVDKNGTVRVDKDGFYMVRTLEDYERISPDEFDRQYARMLRHLEKANAAVRSGS